MKKKGTKIHNRVRKIRCDTLEKLNKTLNLPCKTCCNDCKNHNDSLKCINYSQAIETNDLIEMLKEQNVDLDAFCDKYILKKEFLLEMLKGHMCLKYKYYICLCTRLHVESFCEFDKYKSLFEIDEDDNTEYENNKIDEIEEESHSECKYTTGI